MSFNLKSIMKNEKIILNAKNLITILQVQSALYIFEVHYK